MLSPNMHSKRIFRWMGAETEMTLIFDVLEMMTLNVRKQIGLEQSFIFTI